MLERGEAGLPTESGTVVGCANAFNILPFTIPEVVDGGLYRIRSVMRFRGPCRAVTN